MKGKVVIVAGISLLLSASAVPAQIFGSGVLLTSEVGPGLVSWATTAANSVTTAVNVAASYIRQGEQLVNEYNIIRRQIEQYETMVRNLQRLPEGLNYVDTVLAYGNKLTGVMNQASSLSYDLNDAGRQFEALYLDAETVALGDLRPVKERYHRTRMQAAGVAVQMQAMRTNMSDLFARLCALLDGSWRAQGNLDSQQLAAQQQALQTTTLQQMQALQMTAQRLEAQRQAEEVALARLKQRVHDEMVKPLAEYTEEAGTLPTWQWVTTTSD